MSLSHHPTMGAAASERETASDRWRGRSGVLVALFSLLVVVLIGHAQRRLLPDRLGLVVLAFAWIAGLAYLVAGRRALAGPELAFLGLLLLFLGWMALSIAWTSDVDATVLEVQRACCTASACWRRSSSCAAATSPICSAASSRARRGWRSRRWPTGCCPTRPPAAG